MRAKTAVAMGLLAITGAAWAEAARPGPTDVLGDELFYNYLEGHASVVYLDQSGRNDRVYSDSAYGFTGSVFLADPVYLLASYAFEDFSYDDSTTPTTEVTEETKRTSVGLGVRLPVAFATDLFVTGTYELVDGFVRQTPAGATASTTTSTDAEGGGFEVGARSFLSGFAELTVNYRYREVRADDRPAVGRREERKAKSGVLGMVVPVYEQLSLFGRVEIGEIDSNNSNVDIEFENYLLGARLNFRL